MPTIFATSPAMSAPLIVTGLSSVIRTHPHGCSVRKDCLSIGFPKCSGACDDIHVRHLIRRNVEGHLAAEWFESVATNRASRNPVLAFVERLTAGGAGIPVVR